MVEGGERKENEWKGKKGKVSPAGVYMYDTPGGCLLAFAGSGMITGGMVRRFAAAKTLSPNRGTTSGLGKNRDNLGMFSASDGNSSCRNSAPASLPADRAVGIP